MLTEKRIRRTIKEIIVLEMILDNTIKKILEHNHGYTRGKTNYGSLGLEPMFTLLNDDNKKELLEIVEKIKSKALYFLNSYESKSEEMFREYQGKELSKDDLENIITQCNKMIEKLG